MQQSPLPQNWREFIYLVAAVVLTLIPETYRRYANRKKACLEEAEVKARTVLTEAETRSLQIRDGVAISEQVSKMLSTMMDAGDQLQELHRRVIQAEADSQAALLFVDQLTAAGKLVVCEHHPNGVRLSDYTPQQLNRFRRN